MTIRIVSETRLGSRLATCREANHSIGFWREAVIRDPGRIGDRKSAVGRSMQHICNTMNLPRLRIRYLIRSRIMPGGYLEQVAVQPEAEAIRFMLEDQSQSRFNGKRQSAVYRFLRNT